MNRKLEARWFTNSSGCVGIVKSTVDDQPHRYFIGGGYGLDEMYDAERIADWGSSFPTEIGDQLFAVI